MGVLEERIARARELLRSAHHIALATVNEDGSPHNSPVFFALDEALKHIYWASDPASQHTKNMVRTGQVFGALYEQARGGGLYIQADAAGELSGVALTAALECLNKACAKAGKKRALEEHEYTGNTTQRLYRATVRQLWVNMPQSGPNGERLRDYRQTITAQDLF